jgi:hypothetical protein
MQLESIDPLVVENTSPQLFHFEFSVVAETGFVEIYL